MTEKYLLTHNCSSSGVVHLLNNNEIIMPSLGIINPREHVLEDFGDIVFIADESILNDKAVVMSKDGYTIRAKKIKEIINKDILFDKTVEFIKEFNQKHNHNIDMEEIINKNYKIYVQELNDYFQLKYKNKEYISSMPFSIKNIIRDLIDTFHKNEEIMKKYVREIRKNSLSVEMFLNLELNYFLLKNGVIKHVDENYNETNPQKILDETLNELKKDFNNEIILSEWKLNIERVDLLEIKSLCAEIYNKKEEIINNLHKIKNLSEVQENDELIILSTYEKIINNIDDKYNLIHDEIHESDLLSMLASYIKAPERLTEITVKIFEEHNSIDEDNMTSIKKALDEMKQSLTNGPTTYFEVKIKDILEYSKFKAVLIPQFMPLKNEFVEKMKSIGLDVIEYKNKQDSNYTYDEVDFPTQKTLIKISEKYDFRNTIKEENQNTIKMKVYV